jgi:TrmH family RNA methyltransferase
MISKNQISFITSLHHKKFRKEEGLFIAEGDKTVADLLKSDFKVRELYMTQEFYEMNITRIPMNPYPEIITEAGLKKISALTTPQGILAVAEIPTREGELIEVKDDFTLLLDGIQDPGNLGTIVRIADWFGIANVICSETSTDAFSPKVVQACMGSLFRVKVLHRSLEELLEQNRDKHKVTVYGSMLKGENIYEAKLSDEGFILIGNESKGINDNLKKYITSPVTIPSFSKTGTIDSLNAAMATAIICSEFRRKAHPNPPQGRAF